MRVLDAVRQIAGLALEVWLLIVGVRSFARLLPRRSGSSSGHVGGGHAAVEVIASQPDVRRAVGRAVRTCPEPAAADG